MKYTTTHVRELDGGPVVAARREAVSKQNTCMLLEVRRFSVSCEEINDTMCLSIICNITPIATTTASITLLVNMSAYMKWPFISSLHRNNFSWHIKFNSGLLLLYLINYIRKLYKLHGITKIWCYLRHKTSLKELWKMLTQVRIVYH